ncbi:hypothetical protein Tco_1337249 [Tanacetum coccineum]
MPNPRRYPLPPPTVINAQLKAMINQGVTDALAARDVDRNMNGDDSHNSGIGQLFFKALQQPFISATFDYMYIKSYSFRLFSSLPGVLTPVRGESLKILNGFDVSLPVSHLLWSSQSFGHQKAINGFDMPLPVAVCSGLVNPLAPRKGKFHGGLMTMSTLCT